MIMFKNRPFIRGQIAIDSMRDNGFLSAAHALAEIIDNSIQAKADLVDLMVLEKKKDNSRYEIDEIAVLDNGTGMDAETLHLALEFGESLNKNDPNGIGKFGMGLPNSSISQCCRVEVWSWENLDNITHTYLDIDEIKSGRLELIPQPVYKSIPDWISTTTEKLPNSGTLVIWKKIDRCRWKTAKSIKRNTESLVGRMYRYFLTDESDNKVSIKFKVVRPINDCQYEIQPTEFFRANDPLYLLAETTLPDLPEEFKGESWFQEFDNEDVAVDFTDIDNEGNIKVINSIINIRTTIPKKFIWDKQRAVINKGTLGSSVWGSHAKKNMGVSVVRANRELELRTDLLQKPEWINNGKARFCGVEVRFGPELDNLFGVTNNKQHVVNLKVSNPDDEYESEGFESVTDYLDYLKENENYNHTIGDLVGKIAEKVTAAEKEIRGWSTSPINQMTDETESDPDLNISMVIDGITKLLDEEEMIDPQNPNIDDVVDVLTSTGSTQEEAIKIAEYVIEKKLEVLVRECPLRTEAFFEVTTERGLTYIQINTNHAFYEKILKVLQPQQKLSLELALAAWARYEREVVSSPQIKKMLEITRDKWGRNLEEYLGFDD